MVRKTKAEAEQTRQQIIDAARKVFLELGVGRASLERVAQVAGVTRGAVYWHFENKAALFYAMREESAHVFDELEQDLVSDRLANPLDAIEESLFGFFKVLETQSKVREVFEIMALRCEYVDEFAPVLYEVNKPCIDFLARLCKVYGWAAERGYLRAGLDPEAMAYDTLSFATGLFNNWMIDDEADDVRRRAHAMIRSHVALRRA